MVSDIDIYRSAQAVIQKCGTSFDAKEYAVFRSEKLLEKGESIGARVWLRIAEAIDELQNMSEKGVIH